MVRFGIEVRASIIPDSSVKLMALCLSDDDNEIFMPSTHRQAKELEFRADWALQEIIKERIKRETERIRQDKIEYIFCNGPVPIILRKLLLYNQARAG